MRPAWCRLCHPAVYLDQGAEGLLAVVLDLPAAAEARESDAPVRRESARSGLARRGLVVVALALDDAVAADE